MLSSSVDIVQLIENELEESTDMLTIENNTVSLNVQDDSRESDVNDLQSELLDAAILYESLKLFRDVSFVEAVEDIRIGIQESTISLILG